MEHECGGWEVATHDLAVMDACGGTLRARLHSGAIVPVGCETECKACDESVGLEVQLVVGSQTTTLRTLNELIETCAQRDCSLVEIAARAPDTFAFITKFLIFAHGSGRISGTFSLHDFLLPYFDVDVAEHLPRVVDHELRYLLEVTRPQEVMRPVVPQDLHVYTITINLLTKAIRRTEILRVRD